MTMVDDSKRVEVWGTYSVADHLSARAFVADVLLYDQLVIPRPPTAEEEEKEAAAARARGESWSTAADPADAPDLTEFDRWRSEGWRPTRLEVMLKILRMYGLVIELPWSRPARADWQKLHKELDQSRLGAARGDVALAMDAEVDAARNAYLATAGVAFRYIDNTLRNTTMTKMAARVRATNTRIEPVIAYGSYEQLRSEQASLEAQNWDLSPYYAVFGWEFLVPEDPDLTDYELLDEAARLAATPALREKRQAFHGWLAAMQLGGISPEETRDEMLTLLAEYRDILRGSRLTTAARHAAKIFKVAAPSLAGAAAGAAIDASTGAMLGAAAGAAIGPVLSGPVEKVVEALTETVADAPLFGRLLPPAEIRPTHQAAMMMHDARKHFRGR
jgi:hypothetical protein